MKTIISSVLIVILLIPFEITAQFDTDKQKYEKFSKVESTRMALKLAHYGYEYKSATALIAAAEILSENRVIDLKPSKTGINQIGKETKNYENLIIMLNQARKFAKGDKELIAMANKIENAALFFKTARGVIGGARVGNHQLAPKGTNSFWVVFKANELAEVSVIGTGKNVIELYIYDEKGNLIKKDIKYKAECYVNWQPEVRTAYKIEIKNISETNINYSITTN